ncbi:MAG: metallophosphoesterase [Candidatus Woesearchaeota archaeon]
MLLTPNIKIIRTSLFIESESTLILSDLHIGQDEAMSANGFLMPRFQYEDLFKETQSIIKETKPKRIILNGDIKHEFGGILKEERSKIKEYIQYLKRGEREVIIIKGNHDAILKPLAERENIALKDFLILKDFFICHGDKLFEDDAFKKSKIIIIGHEHPAITLKDGPRKEKYKCFLLGKYEDKKLIVMPAMNPLSDGSDILTQKLLSPYLKNNKNFKKFKAIITDDDKAYDFGEIGKLD